MKFRLLQFNIFTLTNNDFEKFMKSLSTLFIFQPNMEISFGAWGIYIIQSVTAVHLRVLYSNGLTWMHAWVSLRSDWPGCWLGWAWCLVHGLTRTLRRGLADNPLEGLPHVGVSAYYLSSCRWQEHLMRHWDYPSFKITALGSLQREIDWDKSEIHRLINYPLNVINK